MSKFQIWNFQQSSKKSKTIFKNLGTKYHSTKKHFSLCFGYFFIHNIFWWWWWQSYRLQVTGWRRLEVQWLKISKNCLIWIFTYKHKNNFFVFIELTIFERYEFSRQKREKRENREKVIKTRKLWKTWKMENCENTKNAKNASQYYKMRLFELIFNHCVRIWKRHEKDLSQNICQILIFFHCNKTHFGCRITIFILNNKNRIFTFKFKFRLRFK